MNYSGDFICFYLVFIVAYIVYMFTWVFISCCGERVSHLCDELICPYGVSDLISVGGEVGSAPVHVIDRVHGNTTAASTRSCGIQSLTTQISVT